METQTVTFTAEVLKAPADGKPGAIKTDQGRWITVWEDEFSSFSKGVRYKAVVYNKPFKGKDNWVISKPDKGGSIEVVGNAAMIVHAPSNGGDDYEDRKSEAIFVTGVVQQAMASGNFGPTDISLLAKAATQAWRGRSQQEKPTSPLQGDGVPF